MEEDDPPIFQQAAARPRPLLTVNELCSCCRSSLGTINRSIRRPSLAKSTLAEPLSSLVVLRKQTDTAFLLFPMAKQPANGVVNAGEFWEEWSRCITFKYQRDQLYRMGNFDDCGKEWKDYSNVFSVKFTNDPEKASRVLEATHLYKSRTTSPTVGVIWEAKGTPSWD
jgi:hypothetical protein